MSLCISLSCQHPRMLLSMEVRSFEHAKEVIQTMASRLGRHERIHVRMDPDFGMLGWYATVKAQSAMLFPRFMFEDETDGTR